MHLLLIHQAFATPLDSGGTRHYELSRAAIAQGHRVTVVTSGLGYLTGAPTAAAAGSGTVVVDGIHIIRAWAPPTGHSGFLGQLYALVGFAIATIISALRVPDVDLVMGTSPSIFQAASAWFVAAVRGKKFLLEIRDLWPEFIIDMGKLRNPVAIAMARWLERFLYAHADHVLVNSPAYVDYVGKFGVDKSRVTLIPNGVDPDMFAGVTAADASVARAELGVPKEQFLVMYAGVLGPANDIETILGAAERLRDRPDVRIVLVGDGKSRKALEADARARNLANVVFAGSRPKTQMGQVLASADACLATLQNIAMFRTVYPNKVFDYLAAGRPIVLAIDGVIRDVVEAAKAGIFVTPGSPERLADAIVSMAKDRAGAQAMGLRGRDYVARNFNRHEHGRAFAGLVERLAVSSG